MSAFDQHKPIIMKPISVKQLIEQKKLECGSVSYRGSSCEKHDIIVLSLITKLDTNMSQAKPIIMKPISLEKLIEQKKLDLKSVSYRGSSC